MDLWASPPLQRTASSRSEFLDKIGLHDLALTGVHREQSDPLEENQHFRYNIATGTWSLVHLPSDKLECKPRDYKPDKSRDDPTHLRPEFSEGDPFSLSNQHLTPPVKQMFEDPCGNGKPQVRVFDNKFPLLGPIRETEAGLANVVARFDDSLHPQLSGVGTCEVIVQHWKFGMCQALMTEPEVCQLWQAIRDRSYAAEQVTGVRYVQNLENHGIKSGGSLRHPHSQVLGLPYVPTAQRRRLQLALEFYKTKNECIFDHLAQHSRCAAGDRSIYEDEHVVGFVPWSVERSYEMWLVPRTSGARIGDASDTVINAVAKSVSHCLRLLYLQADDPDYNVIVRQAPVTVEKEDSATFDLWYRWHVVIIPSTNSWGGVMAVGDFVCTSATPEEMAERLRSQRGKPLPMPGELKSRSFWNGRLYLIAIAAAGIFAFSLHRSMK